ncbi:hypothetical protein ACODM8_02280 [Vibrio ostreicida]|uniref:hypothetical protein n=1 Tax=Vibrio ostreicida TaxID=526588 RepID=UPI0015C2E81E|nr:hypothetical protein [Vibrio ostreicida]
MLEKNPISTVRTLKVKTKRHQEASPPRKPLSDDTSNSVNWIDLFDLALNGQQNSE